MTGIVGGRYDWWSLRGDAGRPRMGLVYRTEQDTAIKLLYGEAYRAPTVYELFYFERPAGLDLSIDPEIVRTLEAVAERHLGRRLRVAGSIYDTRISDLIDARAVETDTAGYYYANGESARSTGVEIEGESRWPSGLLMRGSVAVQRARPASLSRLSNAPGQLGTLQVAVPFSRRQMVVGSDTTFTS